MSDDRHPSQVPQSPWVRKNSDSHQDIFRNSYWMLDRLIRQVQMHGSRDQGIMIQLIIDYLWHDAHACSEITESLIKLLGANRTRDGWNTWVTHLIRKTIKDSSTASSANTSLSVSGIPHFWSRISFKYLV
jgi:hypothetical protein